MQYGNDFRVQSEMKSTVAYLPDPFLVAKGAGPQTNSRPHSVLARSAQAVHYWEMHLVHLSAQEFVHNSAFPGIAHASAQVFPIVHKHVRKLYKKCTNWKLLRTPN